ncbi:MAG: hypothetical protein PHQ66_02890 [Candidatus Nanoarchaeia archaeon]|nr:hypothetical protein [Candidatus Nanoarchaeia archaeon]MDD5357688.1 hypothetical protein [Candidatus Nanoarchaeia archaeon]MDD5588607.1 hypothetical protein [Candidatus Nanoarchaeia archaeon]
MKIKNKKSSHVGMIVSFVVFITFVVFLYSVVKPVINVGEDKTATLSYIQMRIIENISSNFTSATVIWSADVNPKTECVQLVNFLGFLELSLPPRVIVKNEKNKIEKEVYLFDEVVPDLEINRDDKEHRFFRVYSSPEFNVIETLPLPKCEELTSYTIGSVTTGGYVFENKMYQMINGYRTGYEKLKTALNIPPGTEFGFDFVQNNGTIISLGEPPQTVSVHASEIPIQYIDENANLLSGFINAKVW